MTYRQLDFIYIGSIQQLLSLDFEKNADKEYVWHSRKTNVFVKNGSIELFSENYEGLEEMVLLFKQMFDLHLVKVREIKKEKGE
jgi:hypothetical protein